MTNRFLEKVALNAAKAREMAKAVGVIPDPESAWKYALRNLRDGRGEPLQGKALADARAKLGDLSNNAFQKLKSIDAKVGHPRTTIDRGTTGVEVYGDVDPSGQIQTLRIGGLGEIPGGFQGNFHTHPSKYTTVSSLRADSTSPGTGRLGHPHRIAKASGTDLPAVASNPRYLHDSARTVSNELKAAEEFDKSARLPFLEAKKALSEATEKYGLSSEEAERAKALYDRASEKLVKSHGEFLAKTTAPRAEMAGKYPGLPIRPDGDLGVFTLRPDLLHRIAAPKEGVVSVNKISKNGLRAVYLSHRPKDLSK